MRYFFLLLLLLFLCTSGRAQNITVTADLALASDFCSGPNPDTDCISVPTGNDMLTYLPGVDGDILITYRVTNNTPSTIDRGSLTDSDRGVIFPVGPTNIMPGQTVVINRIYPAETVPRTVTATLTANLENTTTGASATITGQYTLEVVAGEANVEVFPILAEDICTDTTDLATCGVAPIATPNTLEVAPEEVIYLEYRLQNTGLATLDSPSFTDSRYGLLESGATSNPGSDLRFRSLVAAPSLPGTYPITVNYSGLDPAGNVVTQTANYTLEVAAPMVSVEAFPVAATDICTDTTDIATCGVAPTATPNSITTYPGEVIYLEYRLQNTGTVTLVDQEWDDSLYGITTSGANSNPGSDLRFRDLVVAPTSPGTYVGTVDYTGTDVAGNTATATLNYTIEVVAPVAEIEVFLVAAIDICTDTTDLATCGVAPTTTPNAIIAYPGEVIYQEFRLQNTGIVPLTDQEWDDSLYGITTSGANANPGSDLRFRSLIVAPTTPGTYTETVDYTGTDAYGNEVNRTASYAITVDAPIAEVEVFLVAAEAICTDTTDLATCGVAPTATPSTITVAPGEVIYQEFRLQNTGIVPLTDQEWEDSLYGITTSGANANPGSDLRFRNLISAPADPGVHLATVDYTGIDAYGNEVNRTAFYTITTDCSLGDFVPPTARCRDQTFSVSDGGSVTIAPGEINDGSSDNCGALTGGSLDKTLFDCDDEGPNLVTLTVTDAAGKTAACTATVTINVDENVAVGLAGQCTTVTTSLAGGPALTDIRGANGRLIAQINKNANPLIASVDFGLYREATTTEGTGFFTRSSKRFNINFRNAAGSIVQPIVPVTVILYFREAEVDDLVREAGTSLGDLTIIKTSDEDCGTGFKGTDAQVMNANLASASCTGRDYSFRFQAAQFSTFYLFAAQTALPVDLVSFTAEALPKQRARLEWRTASETGNSHYVIERSTDGVDFVALGEVAGAGDSQEEQAYGFIDENPVIGLNYYRLRQVDFDGTEALSDVRQVRIAGGSQLTLYPNPTVAELRLRGFSGGQVRVLDTQGRMVLESNLTAGAPLDVRRLPPGIYALQTSTETIKWIKK